MNVPQCIIFIRDKNSKGQEISGYIDYALRLKTELFEPYFERKKKLLPKSSDLSYYNWETQTSTSNSTPNFQVIADSETGLLFKNKRDRKVVNVDPKVRASVHASLFTLQVLINIESSCEPTGKPGRQFDAHRDQDERVSPSGDLRPHDATQDVVKTSYSLKEKERNENPTLDCDAYQMESLILIRSLLYSFPDHQAPPYSSRQRTK